MNDLLSISGSQALAGILLTVRNRSRFSQ